MISIGDCHGKYNKYLSICSKYSNLKTLQLGDMGIGIVEGYKIPGKDHKFFHGNHDNPKICNRYETYLGRYGIWEGVFYVSGAYSVDKDKRIEGIDWFKDEELSYQEFVNAINLYQESECKVIVSHDAPFDVYNLIHERGRNIKSRTNQALNSFIDFQPDLWVFGHHHKSVRFKFNNIQFVGLAELETFNINAF